MVGQAHQRSGAAGGVTDLDPGRTVPAVQRPITTGYDSWCWPAVSPAPPFGHEEWRPLAKTADEGSLGARPGNSSPVADGLERGRADHRSPSGPQFLQSVVVVGAGRPVANWAGSLVELSTAQSAAISSSCKVGLCGWCWWMRWIGCCQQCIPASRRAAEYLERNGVGGLVWAQWWGRSSRARSLLPRKEGEPRFLEAADRLLEPLGCGPHGSENCWPERSGCAVRSPRARCWWKPDFLGAGSSGAAGGGDLVQARPQQTTTCAPLPGMAGPAVQMGSVGVAGRQFPAPRSRDEVSPAVPLAGSFGSMVGGSVRCFACRPASGGLRVTGLLGWLALGDWPTWPSSCHEKTSHSRCSAAGWWQITPPSAQRPADHRPPGAHIGVDVGLTPGSGGPPRSPRSLGSAGSPQPAPGLAVDDSTTRGVERFTHSRVRRL